ncbi:hypothetical protein [Gottfriedia solisilvae]|uniref:hypothetical protein n=1 Tax=Gottfriedia solisilvae TaxID=1516104 RepID=UPI003D2EA6AC
MSHREYTNNKYRISEELICLIKYIEWKELAMFKNKNKHVINDILLKYLSKVDEEKIGIKVKKINNRKLARKSILKAFTLQEKTENLINLLTEKYYCSIQDIIESALFLYSMDNLSKQEIENNILEWRVEIELHKTD